MNDRRAAGPWWVVWRFERPEVVVVEHRRSDGAYFALRPGDPIEWSADDPGIKWIARIEAPTA